MAIFDSKIFNPVSFGKYMQAIENPKLSRLRQSRAVARDERLIETFKTDSQTGTVYAILPYFGLIGEVPQNCDGATTLTKERTSSFEQGVFTFGRMKAWIEDDFSYDGTRNVDFMANVRSQIMDYWNEADQDTMLAILEGIFSMKDTNCNKANQNFVANHTLDISASDDTATTDDMLISATSLNSAVQKVCGDHKTKFSLAFMHSAVAINLENLNLLQHLKYTDENGVQRDLKLATWNGKLVIIDDAMPTKEEGAMNKHTLYTTYILGDGAFGWEDVGAKVPYEMVRNSFTNSGEDTLVSRRRTAVSVAGISYKKASQASKGLTNEDLKKTENWELVNDGTNAISDKVIPMARIISRG